MLYDQIGQIGRVEALYGFRTDYGFRSHRGLLVACGVTNGSGWRHYFIHNERGDYELDFVEIRPNLYDEDIGSTKFPFHTHVVLPDDPRSVRVRCKLGSDQIAVHQIHIDATPAPQDLILAKLLQPVRLYEANDPAINKGKREHATHYERVLAVIDNPLDCLDWGGFKGSKTTLTLIVDVASEQDISRAVEDCLAAAAVASALAALVAAFFGGASWQAAAAAFVAVLKPSLESKLTDLVRVDIDRHYSCN